MTFDPYSAWLGLPAGPRPPDPYTLLGVRRFERDIARISAAARERVGVINRKAPFDRGDEMRQLLAELSSAERLLTDPARRRRFEIAQRAAEKRTTRPAPDAEESRTHSQDGSAKPVHENAARSDRPAARRVPLPAIAAGLAALLLLPGAAWIAWPEKTPAAVAEAKGDAVEASSEEDRLIVAKVDQKSPPPRLAPSRPPVQAATPITAAEADEMVAATAAEADEVAEVDDRSSPVTDSVEISAAPPAAFSAIAPPVEARKLVLLPSTGYVPPKFASDRDAEAYARHVRDLLHEAFKSKGDPSSIEQHRREADALAPGHPFTAYAAALADWKRLRFAEADARLRSALGPDDRPFLPARRASIRLHLNRNRRPEALHEAIALAAALQAEGDADSREARTASVRWLGRLIAALEAPWLPDASRSAEVAEADAAIRDALGPDRSAAYDAGRQSLREDYAALAADVEARIAELSVDLEERRAEALDKIAEDRDAAQDGKEQVSRTAAEWKDWFDKETKGLDETLKKLEAAHQQLSVQAEAAAATWIAISGQIAAVQAQEQNSTNSVGFGSSAEAGALMVVANQASAQLKLLNAQLAEVRRQAQVALTARQAVVTRFERETRTLTVRSDSLRKWEGLLKRRADAAGAEEATDSSAAKALRRRLRDFDTYLPFDLDAERDAVLQALRERS